MSYSYSKEQILNLFLDNITNDITPSDMRIFVNTIFDNKENSIRKLSTLNDIHNHPILKNDLVVISDTTGIDDQNDGIYLSETDNPYQNNLKLIASTNSGLTIDGEDGQVLSITNGELTWIDQPLGYKILGTKNIYDILLLKPYQSNIVYIAGDTNLLLSVPGVQGDGYSWDGGSWSNIGKLAGVDGTNGTNGADGSSTALDTTADVTNFNNNLSASDTDVQKALDTLDNLSLGGSSTALDTTTNVTNFNNNLSASDTDVQKALDTLDNLSLGGGASELEKITEGGNTGWRILGVEAANYGDIGHIAIDLSMSTSASSTKGATGYNSFAWGENTTASGWASYAGGRLTVSSGEQSFAVGNGCQATNKYALAEGDITLASGWASHAEGGLTQATESNAHAEGYDTRATNTGSHSEGIGTIALNVGSHAAGQYNIGTSLETIHETGIGTWDNKKNAFEIYTNGRIRAPELTTALIVDDKSLVTKEYAVGSVPVETGETRISNMVKITQADYDNIGSPSADTFYVIVG